MKHITTIQTEFSKIALKPQGRFFPVEDVIVGDEKLPGYNDCGLDCKHLSQNQDKCYLFQTDIKDLKRGKLCLTYTEGQN